MFEYKKSTGIAEQDDQYVSILSPALKMIIKRLQKLSERKRRSAISIIDGMLGMLE